MRNPLNGYTKWIVALIALGGLLISTGKVIENINECSAKIRAIEEIKIEARLTKVETSFDYIKEKLNHIEKKLDK